MDNFKEEVAVRRSRTLYDVLYMLCFTAMIVSALLALVTLQGVLSMVFEGSFHPIPLVTLILFGGMGFLLWRYKDELRSEYEYTFTNGILDFAQVFNNKKRKNLGTMNLKNITACGLVTSGSFNRYINMQGVKRSNWFINREAELFYIYFEKDGNKRIIIMEPSNEMVAMIRRVVPQGAFQVN